jgi:hypothetical protein
MTRQDAARVLKTVVRERLSNQCAACDGGNALNIDVAHLFEDATARQPAEERLILLCANCNQTQDRAKHPKKPGYVDRLQAPEISALALRRYRKGDYRGAYQSSRLAAYLFEQHAQYSKSAACLIAAISALRPLRWGDLLYATLLEFERLCTSRPISVVQRWLFLDCLGLVLYDFRRWKQSSYVHEESLRLRAKLRSDQRDPEQLLFDQMSSYRNEALIQSSVGRRSRRAVAGMVKRLEDDASEFLKRGQRDSYATNLDVAAKLELEVLGNQTRALQLGEVALEMENQITHWWVLQEHYWRMADLYAQKNDRVREIESVVAALRVFQEIPVVLEPTRIASGPVRHDPIGDLARHQIPDGYLKERNVAPSGDAPRELPLRLREAGIKRIVNAVLGRD